MNDRSKPRLALAVWTGMAAVAFAVLYFFDPRSCSLLPPCPFHAMTGLWCPGCGSTRGLHALAHGHLLQALRFNPLMVASLPFLLSVCLFHSYQLISGQTPARVFVKPSWIWTMVAVVVAFGLLRNVPVFPFTLLAP
jgi:uncharacterized protein DUF2752